MKIQLIYIFIFCYSLLYAQGQTEGRIMFTPITAKALSSTSANNIHIDSLLLDGVPIHYVDILDEASMNSMSNMLGAEQYPFTLVRQKAFLKLQTMVELYEQYYKSGEKYRDYTAELEQLHQLERNQLAVLTELQEQRIENFKVLSENLHSDALVMNELLSASLENNKKAIKGKTLKNIWIGSIGGAIGFLTGGLIFK